MATQKKREYTMTPAEFEQFKSACNPPGYKAVAECPMPLSAEERAIVFWAKLSRVHGFDPNTVEPVLGETGHPGKFLAVPAGEAA